MLFPRHYRIEIYLIIHYSIFATFHQRLALKSSKEHKKCIQHRILLMFFFYDISPTRYIMIWKQIYIYKISQRIPLQIS